MTTISRLALAFVLTALVSTRLLGESSPSITPIRAITASDRLFVLAPHPDDESLGAGGIIQRALAAHARVRVLFTTNGDNNAWVQRLLEHRWKVGPVDRTRWGARRQKEALAALARLGVARRDIYFLDLPDQGTTAELMREPGKLVAAFANVIRDFHPTIAVLPSEYDLHPDHNTSFVLAHLAFEQAGISGYLELDYLVHTRGLVHEIRPVGLALSPAEVARKRAAILCHTTQTAISRKSLLRFVKPEEVYDLYAPPRSTDPHHPVCEADLQAGALRLSICDPRGFFGGRLLVVARNRSGAISTRFLIIQSRQGSSPLIDGQNNRPVGRVDIDSRGEALRLRLPLSGALQDLYVKLDRRGIFLDRGGWRAVPVNSD